MRRTILIPIICVTGIFLLPMGCDCGVEKTVEAGLGTEFILQLGRGAIIEGEGLHIYFEKVIEDSRCPLGTDCDWRGEVVYTMRFTHNEASDWITLYESGQKDQSKVTFLDYTVDMSVEPYPTESGGIKKKDYRLRMFARKRVPSHYSMEEEADIYATVIRGKSREEGAMTPTEKDLPILYLVGVTLDYTERDYEETLGKRILPEPLRSEITDRLDDLSFNIKWVSDFSEVPLGEDHGVKGGGAIVTVGNIEEVEAGILHIHRFDYVADYVSYATTYVLEKQDGVWEVTGTTEPSVIS